MYMVLDSMVVLMVRRAHTLAQLDLLRYYLVVLLLDLYLISGETKLHLIVILQIPLSKLMLQHQKIWKFMLMVILN
jgi:hypothetical protein